MALRIVTLAALFAFAIWADAAPVPQGKTTADKLVGRWQLTKSRGNAPAQDHFVVFEKDGKMTLEVHNGDTVTKYEGKFKATEKAIDYELKMGSETKTEKLDIKELSDDEMKTTDPDGVEEEFKRVKEKDKKEK